MMKIEKIFTAISPEEQADSEKDSGNADKVMLSIPF